MGQRICMHSSTWNVRIQRDHSCVSFRAMWDHLVSQSCHFFENCRVYATIFGFSHRHTSNRIKCGSMFVKWHLLPISLLVSPGRSHIHGFVLWFVRWEPIHILIVPISIGSQITAWNPLFLPFWPQVLLLLLEFLRLRQINSERFLVDHNVERTVWVVSRINHYRFLRIVF